MDPILDDEFKGLIPDDLYSEEEYNQLERNTINEKEPEKSIVFYTWNGRLLDGYPLFEICQKHGIKFRTVEMEFPDRDEAKVWVLNRHLAMPTYTTFFRIELISKRDDIIRRQEQGKQRMVEAAHPKKNTDDTIQKSEKQPTNEIAKVNVTKEIAEKINSSTDTVSRGLQLLKSASEAVKHKLRTGEITIHEATQNQRKLNKELEAIKNKGSIKSELQTNMSEMDKDVITKKTSTKNRDIVFKIIPLLLHEDLKLIKVRVDQELSNSDQTQVSTTTDSFPPAPAPTALTGTEDATETDTETKVN